MLNWIEELRTETYYTFAIDAGIIQPGLSTSNSSAVACAPWIRERAANLAAGLAKASGNAPQTWLSVRTTSWGFVPRLCPAVQHQMKLAAAIMSAAVTLVDLGCLQSAKVGCQ
eukprot:scaffold359631_cov18-Prasinocladus_malaysianus.AAC.1